MPENTPAPTPKPMPGAAPPPYQLDDQVGYLMRLASQRHTTIFQTLMVHDLTPPQFAMLIRLGEVGVGSQNQLGRLTAIDAATTKGIVDRLKAKGLITLSPDPNDGRRSLIALSDEGVAVLDELKRCGHDITAATLEPLTPSQRSTFLKLLRRLT